MALTMQQQQRMLALLVALGSSLAVTDVLGSAPAAGPAPEGPCDLFLKDRTPCVAAHSMTRALYGSYSGALYTLLRQSDNATKDVTAVGPGGIADTATHRAFCGSAVCIVLRILDQSPRGNHLGIERGAANLAPPRNVLDLGVNFTDNRSSTTLGGRAVYSAFFAGPPPGYGYNPFQGQGYSNRTAVGTAVGDEPETIVAVVSGRYFNGQCCFDYVRLSSPHTFPRAVARCALHQLDPEPLVVGAGVSVAHFCWACSCMQGNGENVRAGKEGVLKQGTMEAIYFGEGCAYTSNLCTLYRWRSH